MLDLSQSRILQVLILGVVTIVTLGIGSVCSLAVDRRHLLEESFDVGYGGAQFQLRHWSHPRSPLYVPGLSLAKRFKDAMHSSRERVAGLSSGMPVSSTESPNATVVSPVSNLLWEYGMEITLVTSTQIFTGIADTGSDFVWVQCLPCFNCTAQPGRLFDPTKSSTYKGVSCKDPLCMSTQGMYLYCANETCQYSVSYGIGTMGGDLARETFTLNTTTGKANTVSDFCLDVRKLTTYLWNVDGLVGLGKAPFLSPLSWPVFMATRFRTV